MITSSNQYNELADLTDKAEDRLVTGSGEPGTHYMLMHVLRQSFGIAVFTREDAIKQARKLCNEYLDGLREHGAIG